MSQKTPKPTLTGQRLKTRKRDEKEKYDPIGFRDAVILGIYDASDLDQLAKFLDTAGSRLNYRRYADVLFDILFAGGILAPGGGLIEDEKARCELCVFLADNDLDAMKAWAQVFNLLIRRYKYLEKAFEEEMAKILMFLKGYTEEERSKLAKITALFLSLGRVQATILNSLFNDQLVKEGIALEFATEMFTVWLSEKDIGNVSYALRKAQLETKLLNYLPVNKRTPENFAKHFNDVGLDKLVAFMRIQRNVECKKELQNEVSEMIRNQDSVREIGVHCKEQMKLNNLEEFEVTVLLWRSLMDAVEWNKKEDLVAEQALRHLNTYSPLLAEFTSQGKSETALILKIQDYCYDNMNFMKVFQKIIILLYKSDVLSEDVILKWYREDHLAKGKSVFLQQLQKFVEWLQNAEEESSDEEDS